MGFKLHLSSTNWLHDAFTSATGSFERGMILYLVVSTPLKNISQNGNLPQIEVKIKNL